MKHAKLLLIACAGVVAVTGCGQKGPLVLPDKNAKIITRPAGTRAAQPITPPADATPGANIARAGTARLSAATSTRVHGTEIDGHRDGERKIRPEGFAVGHPDAALARSLRTHHSAKRLRALLRDLSTRISAAQVASYSAAGSAGLTAHRDFPAHTTPSGHPTTRRCASFGHGSQSGILTSRPR